MNKIELLVKYMDLLNFVKDNEKYLTEIYKRSKLTQLSIYKLANLWLELGIVEVVKKDDKRKVFLKLTDKGKKVVEFWNEFVKLIGVEK